MVDVVLRDNSVVFEPRGWSKLWTLNDRLLYHSPCAKRAASSHWDRPRVVERLEDARYADTWGHRSWELPSRW